LSVAEPKYFSPAFFAQKSSWADAVSKVHASKAVVIRLNLIMTCDDENFRDKGRGSECESHEGKCRSGGVLTLLNDFRRELETREAVKFTYSMYSYLDRRWMNTSDFNLFTTQQ